MFNSRNLKSIIESLNKSTSKKMIVAVLFLGLTLCYQNFSSIGENQVTSNQTRKISSLATGSSNDEKAHRMFRRLAGVVIPIDDPRINQMSALLAQGKDLEAAKIATESNEFYDITVREFAAAMSTRELTVQAPLSDFVATVVGQTRDNGDARELLRGNFYYKGSAAIVPSLSTADNERDDILASNDHYTALEQAIDARTATLKTALIKVDGQKIITGEGNKAITEAIVAAHPDPAGIITSRAYLSSHAIAGTNRRLVEYLFKSFMCTPLSAAADTSAPDSFVGPDVDRFPQGSNKNFQTSCKGCHSGMDAMRPAFAMVTFEGNIVKFADKFPATNNDTAGNTRAIQVDTKYKKFPSKFTRGSAMYPDGFYVRDTNWVNYFALNKGQSLFGWRGNIQGQGIKQIGSMIAESQGYSGCLVQRVFKSVCKRDLQTNEQQLLHLLRSEFETDYNLKTLFERVSTRAECIGI